MLLTGPGYPPFDFAYDPTTNRALLVAGSNAVSWSDFGAALTCVAACAAPTTATWFGGVDPAQLSVTRNPIAGDWLVTTNAVGGTPTVYAFLDDLTLAAGAYALNQGGLSSTSAAQLACPAQSAFPVADLRFEEMPGASVFADSSRWGRDVTPAVGASPVAGASGAPLAGNSHTSARFVSSADQLVVPAGSAPASSGGASLAFWYRADRNVAGSPFTIDTGASGYRLEIDHQGSVSWRSGVNDLSVNATSLADGEWHFVAVARDENSPTYVFTRPYPTMSVYVDGALVGARADNGAFAPSSAVTITGGSSTVSVDQLQVFNVALSADAVAAVRSNAEPFCMVAATNGSALPWWKLAFRGSDGRGAELSANASLLFRVDSDVPTSSVVVPDTALNASVSTYVLAGSAVDPVNGSGVASVEVSLDGGPWTTATGTESWTLPIELGSGNVQIRTRATDFAGNVETPSAATALLVDRVNPTVSLDPVAPAEAPTRDSATGQLLVALAGTSADAGSGVETVEVSVAATGSPVSPAAWKPATVSGGVWSLDYRMPSSVFEVSGSYTVSVRAADMAGNHTADDAASAVVFLDNTAPAVSLSAADQARKVLAGSAVLTGPVTDVSGAGVASVDVAFTPIDEATSATPPPTVWHPATLEQSNGSSTSTPWSIDVPDETEGYFQIDLRATDSLGNQMVSRRVWSGIIDTRAPRLSLTASPTGRRLRSGTQVEIGYSCAAEDLFLDPTKFKCPGVSAKPATRAELAASSLKTALQTTFPGMAVIAQLSVSYNSWEASTSNNVTLTACDMFGNCSSRVSAVRSLVRAAQRAAQSQVSSRAVSPFVADSAPTAMIASPSDGDHVAVGSTAGVVVSATAAASIKRIDVLVDGVVAATRTPAFGAEFAHEEVVTVSIAAGGSHTLEVITTDWNDVTGSSGEVGFFADLTAPSVTLVTTNLTLGDTWAVGTDFYRFSGTVTDDGTVAAVQIRVNGGNWTDAAFAAGAWHTALQIAGADGTNLSVSVRAFDLAGRVTTVIGTTSVNLLPAQPAAYVRPGTTIVTGPAATVVSAQATFTFGGLAGDNGVSTFRCQLDTNTPVLCGTPFVLGGLAAGRHTLRVAAIDDAGYVDLTPATRSWTVTATGPRPTMVSAPAGSVTARTARFEFTAPTGAMLECSLDGGAPAPCTSPHTTTALGDGVHTFTVQATLAGVSGTAVAATWTVVNLAPVAADQTVAVDADSTDGRSVTLSAADVTALVYRVAAAPAHGYLVGAAPNIVYVPFRGYRGTDRFTFVADDGQNVSRTGTVSVQVKVPDKLAPVIKSPGDQTIHSAFPGTDPITYRLPTATDNSGSAAVVCVPASGTRFSAGATPVRCTATDESGNSATVRFVINHVIDPEFRIPLTGNGHLPIQEALLLLVVGLALVVSSRRRNQTRRF
ncbi:MAG: LamG-like jellyroll fold domain-containing protein [Actinomycetota bacterium]